DVTRLAFKAFHQLGEPWRKLVRRLAVASSLQGARHSGQDCMDIFDRVRHLGGSNFHRPLSAETVAFEKGSWGVTSSCLWGSAQRPVLTAEVPKKKPRPAA